MPVAPYGSDEYRRWNRERMWRRRREGIPWDRNYETSHRGVFMRQTYAVSSRRYILRANHDHGTSLEPRQTMANLNESRDLARMIERAGGFDMYRVRLESGL